MPAETVDVVNVVTSAADADQGTGGSSSITVVTKSGTNQIHGSAFEFHNDQHLNARNFFLQPGTSIPVGIYNNYGGTIGGPIKKDKLFYFCSYDSDRPERKWQRLVHGSDCRSAGRQLQRLQRNVANLQSDYRQSGRHGPHTVSRTTSFPHRCISQQALNLQSYYPAPNLAGHGQ